MSPARSLDPFSCIRCGRHLLTAHALCPSCVTENITSFLATLAPQASTSSPPFPYHQLTLIGQGAMSRVYSAQHQTLGRHVALKILNSNLARDPAHLLRFQREAQTIARLRHRHIVTLHEHGLTPEGAPYLAMDLLPDGDLAQRLRHHRINTTDAAELVRKIALALAYAHAQGVLHRDLKPSNILLHGAEPAIADFGLAAQLEPGGDLTAATTILGTPHYLAPEIIAHGSAAAAPASDVYALGVILYECLTGRTPYAGATTAQLPHLIATTEPIAPRLLSPGLARDLETICLKTIERDPARRYVSAEALADDLTRYLDGRPILARPLSSAARFWRWCRRRPALAAIWFLLLALVGVSLISNRLLNQSRTDLARSLDQTRTAELSARERLRDARHAEARALLSTRDPARRARIFSALKEASAIRADLDLRDTALAALLQPELDVSSTWDLSRPPPTKITIAPGAAHVAFEPVDASGLKREPLQLIDRPQTKTRATLAVPGTHAVGSLHYSSDARLILCRYADETVRLWNAAGGELLMTLRERTLPGGSILTEPRNNDYAFTPDASRFVLGLPGGGIALHRTSDGAELARFEEETRYDQVRLSASGRHFVAARLYNSPPTQPRIFSLDGSDRLGPPVIPNLSAAAECFNWSADGQFLAIGLTNRTIALVDPATGDTLQTIASPARQHLSIEFFADDQLLAVRTRGSPRLHLLNRALNHEEFTLPDIGMRSPTAGKDRFHFSTASQQNVITDWQLQPAVGYRTLLPLLTGGFQALAYGNHALTVSPDQHWLLSAHGRNLVLYDFQKNKFHSIWLAPASTTVEISGITLTTDPSKLIRSSSQNGIQLLDFNPARTPAFSLHAVLDAEPGFTIADSKNDHLLLINSTTGETKITRYDPRIFRATTRSRWRTPGAFGGALSPDCTQAVINCSGAGPDTAEQKIQVRQIADGTLLHSLDAPVCCDAIWSQNGKTVLTSNGKAHYLWDARTWQPLKTFGAEYGGALSCFALSPNGRQAAILFETQIRLLDLDSGKRIATLSLPGVLSSIVTLSYSPDGNEILALWRDGRIDRLHLAQLNAALRPLGLAWPDL